LKETLAPIHYMQHRRIKIQENLAFFLADLFMKESVLTSLYDDFGPPSKEVDLGVQIDHDHIHHWLASHVISQEKRMAHLIYAILQETTEEALHLAHKEYGEQLGNALQIEELPANGQGLYDVLQGILLDGMPCDKINHMGDYSGHHLVFTSIQDLHGPYFHEAGLPASLAQSLRASFLEGFLKNFGLYTYQYTRKEDSILHKILW